jgi:hypothetical protein
MFLSVLRNFHTYFVNILQMLVIIVYDVHEKKKKKQIHINLECEVEIY